jgi:hypothetical protein
LPSLTDVSAIRITRHIPHLCQARLEANGFFKDSTMAAGIIFMQWDNYAGGRESPPFFADEPLTFNTRQERLHQLAAGDHLWHVSRCPDKRPTLGQWNASPRLPLRLLRQLPRKVFRRKRAWGAGNQGTAPV